MLPMSARRGVGGGWACTSGGGDIKAKIGVAVIKDAANRIGKGGVSFGGEHKARHSVITSCCGVGVADWRRVLLLPC